MTMHQEEDHSNTPEPLGILVGVRGSPQALPDGLKRIDLRLVPRVTFGRVRVSEAAERTVASLVAKVETWEESQGTRKRARRAKDWDSFVDAVGRFTGDLAASIGAGGKCSPVACPKAAGAFGAQSFGYDTFMGVYRAFGDLGLIEVVSPGWYARSPEFGPKAGRGELERIRATDALADLLATHGIPLGQADEHFALLTPPPSLSLRESSVRYRDRKLRGASMKVPSTPETRRLAEEVEGLNSFIRGFKLEGVPFTGWTRGFNQGDHEGFAWDLGGRLYAQPAGSYQGLPGEGRLALRIEGEPLVEIDIKASHLALVYALKGLSLREAVRVDFADGTWSEGDPYCIEGLPRKAVKAWITATLGNGKHPTRWAPETARRLREAVPDWNPRELMCRKVGAAVLARHPVLSDLTGITWGRLQFLESQVIIGAMVRLRDDYGIPALPVHDSLMVPRPVWFTGWEVLGWEVERVTGRRPLRFKTAPGVEKLPSPAIARIEDLSSMWGKP